MDTAEEGGPLIVPDAAVIGGRLHITHVLDPPGLRVGGDLDFATLPMLNQALESIDGEIDFFIDLGGLTFIDVGSLRALVTTAGRFDDGNLLTLLAAPVQVRRLLDLTGWHAVPRLRLEDRPPASPALLADLARMLGVAGERGSPALPASMGGFGK